MLNQKSCLRVSVCFSMNVRAVGLYCVRYRVTAASSARMDPSSAQLVIQSEVFRLGKHVGFQLRFRGYTIIRKRENFDHQISG